MFLKEEPNQTKEAVLKCLLFFLFCFSITVACVYRPILILLDSTHGPLSILNIELRF
jgi:hypothetical protein